ncbi:glycosyltransferase family 4 protein [Patescibacteria group bacterium]|nr:glycosyltransferase family 4 protein [Patescibacteria group bacterium]MBU1673281.1 glycosyltransferase family 4 protein [Patescibacteria group bacterium]MBU1963334.1 glycosyltransferase family 4 protein [Patescibacteria group bacterium]
MKIAMIGQKGIPAIYGGIERHVEELSVRLVDAGLDVSVYTRPHYSQSDKKTYRGIKMISTPSLHSKHFDAISHTLTSAVDAMKKDFDVYHFHAVGPALLSFLPRIFRPKAKVVVTFHCIDRQHQKWGRMARLMLWLGEWAACKFAHEVVTVSKTLRHYCYEVYNRKTIYIPNGISNVQNEKPSIIESEFGLEKDGYIVMVARLVQHKGVHYLIDAYNQIHGTDKKLVIVGDTAFTDDYVAKVKAMAKDNPNIIFTGYQSGRALNELFSNAYMYVHPSESEGLPIAVLEAAAYGRCVLASDIPANLEVVKECGLVFENKNVDDLREKMEMLLASPEEVEKTGKIARKYVLKHYNWDDIAKQTKRLYTKLQDHQPVIGKMELSKS